MISKFARQLIRKSSPKPANGTPFFLIFPQNNKISLKQGIFPKIIHTKRSNTLEFKWYNQDLFKPRSQELLAGNFSAKILGLSLHVEKSSGKQEVKEMAATGNVPNKLLTLVMIMKNNQILLGMKKRGFGVNRWNGFGGKLQPGESILDAAKRLDSSYLRSTLNLL